MGPSVDGLPWNCRCHSAIPVDGWICDAHQILEAEFPVFYHYRHSNGSLGRCLITHRQIPIRIGDVYVTPGVMILGDFDGVLCVSHSIACEGLERRKETEINEKAIFGWVAEGRSAEDITKDGGYF